MATDWHMPRRSDACVVCGEKFEVGQIICAALFEVDEGYERRDRCEGCAPAAPAEAIAQWRTRRRDPGKKRGAPFDRTAMYEFFTRLDDPQTPNRVQFRFALALLLWRKKVLSFESSEQRDDKEYWRFRRPKSEDEFAVERPELDETQIERLSMQLEQLLADPPEDLDAAIDEPAADAGEDDADTDAGGYDDADETQQTTETSDESPCEEPIVD